MNANQPTQTELEKAIRRIEDDFLLSTLEDICQFKQDVKLITDVVKQVSELREQLDTLLNWQQAGMRIACRLVGAGIKTDGIVDGVEELINQLHSQRELIEKLVEALIPFQPGIDYFPWGKIKAACSTGLASDLTKANMKAFEALSVAREQGFGKKDEIPPTS